MIAPEILTVNWDISSAEKGGYEHFMIKEIMEQPKAVRDTVSPRLENDLPRLEDSSLTESLFQNLRAIHIVACGSALHAGLVGREVIERFARVPVFASVASEFRYRNPVIGEGDLCIVISQSGETADTLAAMREAKNRGARTIAIVNVVSSSAAREADSVLYTWARDCCGDYQGIFRSAGCAIPDCRQGRLSPRNAGGERSPGILPPGESTS